MEIVGILVGILRSATVVAMAKRRGAGEGTIRENKARNRWEGRITIGYDTEGRQRRKLVTGAKRADVVAKLREVAADLDAGIERQSATTTVKSFLETWLRDAVAGSVAPTTEQQYGDVVRLYIVPRIGQKRVRTLQPAHVAEMLRDMERPTAQRPNGYSFTARRLARAVLRAALRWGIENDYTTRNVAQIARAPKAERSDRHTMTPAQAHTFLDHVRGDRLEALYVVGLALGLRVSELLGLAWDDVDLDADVPALRVRRSLKRLRGRGLVLGEVKTPTSRRTVHLPAVAVAALRDHRRRQAGEQLAYPGQWPDRPLGVDLVFRSTSGTALDPSNVAHELANATEAAGIGHWTPHSLRHSAASLLIAQGVPLKVVSETLGHSSIAITADVYGHIFAASRSEAAAAMDRALGR